MTRPTQFLKRKALLIGGATGVSAMLAATALIGLPASSDAASAGATPDAAPAPVAASHGGVGAKHHGHGRRGNARSRADRRATASDVTSGGRPQITLYMSGEEVGRLWLSYEACLAEGGFHGYMGGELSAEQEAQIAAAEPGCADAKPIPAPSTDPAVNPHFAQDRAAEVACDNAAGLPVEAISGGWTYAEATDARGRFLLSLEGEAARDQIERTCELKAFSPDEPLPES